MDVLPAPQAFSKIASYDDACARAAMLPKPLVFTNGVFDILHCGHVAYLDQARQLGKSLVVAVNSDASVRRLNKGDERPLNALEDRMMVLAGLASVDLVVPFDEGTPRDLIVRIMPDILVKGGDYSAQTTAGATEVLANGGRFVAVPFLFERSTTALVDEIMKAHRDENHGHHAG
jgi:cytidyltransferase-related domain